MAKIKPFKGVLYNRSIAGNISKVVAPPYDVVSPKMRDALYKLHKDNIVRLILAKESPSDNKFNNKYTRAKNTLDNWLRENILVRDNVDSIYICGQRYLHKGEYLERFGLISLLRFEDASKTKVYPHENTFDKPKLDRAKLIQALGANLSQIFCLFSDKNSRVDKIIKKVISSGMPVIDIDFDSVRNRLWRVSDKRLLKLVEKEMANKSIFIADGHHRFEAARISRDIFKSRDPNYTRESPYNFVMVYLTNLENEGITILSTHRVVKGLKAAQIDKFFSSLDDFIVSKLAKKSLFRKMESLEGREHAFGVYYKKEYYLLRLKNKSVLDKITKLGFSKNYFKLDAVILHELIFDKLLGLPKGKEETVSYTRDEFEAVKWVDKKKFQIAFFLNPTTAAQVRDIALGLDKMPHKSTYFYPKLLSGLVIYKY